MSERWGEGARERWGEGAMGRGSINFILRISIIAIFVRNKFTKRNR